jgi:hypothetical protein
MWIWNTCQQQLKLLALELGGLAAQTGDIAARPRKVLDQARSNRIADSCEHDRDCRRRGFERLGRKSSPPRYQHIRLYSHEFIGKGGKSRGISLGGSLLEA